MRTIELKFRKVAGSAMLIVVVLGGLVALLLLGNIYRVHNERYVFGREQADRLGKEAGNYAAQLLNVLLAKQVIFGYKTLPTSPFPNTTYWEVNATKPPWLNWPGFPAHPAHWNQKTGYAQKTTPPQQATFVVYYCNANQLTVMAHRVMYSPAAQYPTPVAVGPYAACDPNAAPGAPIPAWYVQVNISFTGSNPVANTLDLTVSAVIPLLSSNGSPAPVLAGFGSKLFDWLQPPEPVVISYPLTVPLPKLLLHERKG